MGYVEINIIKPGMVEVKLVRIYHKAVTKDVSGGNIDFYVNVTCGWEIKAEGDLRTTVRCLWSSSQHCAAPHIQAPPSNPPLCSTILSSDSYCPR